MAWLRCVLSLIPIIQPLLPRVFAVDQMHTCMGCPRGVWVCVIVWPPMFTNCQHFPQSAPGATIALKQPIVVVTGCRLFCWVVEISRRRVLPKMSLSETQEEDWHRGGRSGVTAGNESSSSGFRKGLHFSVVVAGNWRYSVYVVAC